MGANHGCQEMSEIVYSVEGGIATVTLNRPEKMNAWTRVMGEGFEARMREAAADPSVRAIVITGAGRGFCAGGDMAALQAMGAPGAAAAGSVLGATRRFMFLTEIDKPLIAAVHGPAVGVGFVLTLWCDLRYAAGTARLATGFARRGYVAEHGSAWLLTRLVGPMRAADLILSGRTIEAAEAERMGLLTCLPGHDVLPAVQGLARDMVAATSPRSVAVMKRQLRLAATQTLAEAVDLADSEGVAAQGSEDFREGVAHFLEKRPPRFTGR